MYITKIEKQENGKYKLTFNTISIYSNKTAAFSGAYNTIRGAKIAESKLMKKYDNEQIQKT